MKAQYMKNQTFRESEREIPITSFAFSVQFKLSMVLNNWLFTILVNNSSDTSMKGFRIKPLSHTYDLEYE